MCLSLKAWNKTAQSRWLSMALRSHQSSGNVLNWCETYQGRDRQTWRYRMSISPYKTKKGTCSRQALRSSKKVKALFYPVFSDFWHSTAFGRFPGFAGLSFW
jgi:hypothetical protein